MYNNCETIGECNLDEGEIRINLQFGGGAELLFGNIKSRQITLTDCRSGIWTIKELLIFLRENLLRDREELFFQGNSVRPGILVMINETDWELLGELEYIIQPGDTILFISTLHGG